MPHGKYHTLQRLAEEHPQGSQIRLPDQQMPSPYQADKTHPENDLLLHPHHGSTERFGNNGQFQRSSEAA